jgi:hypothetical protein
MPAIQIAEKAQPIGHTQTVALTFLVLPTNPSADFAFIDFPFFELLAFFVFPALSVVPSRFLLRGLLPSPTTTVGIGGPEGVLP